MVYKIDDKYYVKVGKDFTEVQLIYKDNDVDLKPTKNVVENNGNLKIEEINFTNKEVREQLLKEQKKTKPSFENKNKNFTKSSFR